MPYQIYDISKNLITECFQSPKTEFEKWNQGVVESDLGRDYREGELTDPNARRVFWTDMLEYQPYFKDWKLRPEYKSRLKDN